MGSRPSTTDETGSTGPECPLEPEDPAYVLAAEVASLRIEAANREKELSAVYETAPLVMLLVDEDRRIRKANQPAAELAASSVDDLLDRRAGDALRCLNALDDPDGCGFGPQCGRCTLRLSMLETLETGRSHHQVEASLPFGTAGKADGATFLLSTSPLNVRDKPHVLVTIQDISERKQAEREREATIEFLRLANASRGSDDLTRAAASFFQQRSGCHAVGIRLKDGDAYPYVELPGFPQIFLQATTRLRPRDDQEQVGPECLCGNVISGRFDRTQPGFTAQGSFCTNSLTELRSSPTNVRPCHWCGFDGYESVALIPLYVGRERLGLLQLSDRRPGRFSREATGLWERLAGHLAAALANFRAKEALLEADRYKNEFLAMLSHELRNPLAPIRNSLFILDRAAPGGEQAGRAKAVIKRQVGHLTRLVDDLLDATRISQGRIRLQCGPLDLTALTRRTAEDYRPVLAAGGLGFEVRADEKPVWVNGDPDRLTQAIGNLLQNALKFSRPGGSVALELEREANPRAAVIRVHDDGIGISTEVLPRLFRPFEQADGTLDRVNGGLGLGLALVKRLVELHGGTVEAHSEGLGAGAVFTIRLPLGADAGIAVDGGQNPNCYARRVLIIEDNVDAAESLREALELEGHRVQIAHNGPSGLESARELTPDIVLCDIGLPGMNGYDVARAFRTDQALGSVFLVALTGYARPEDLAQARAAGFDEHIAKPATLERIDEVLARAPPAAA